MSFGGLCARLGDVQFVGHSSRGFIFRFGVLRNTARLLYGNTRFISPIIFTSDDITTEDTFDLDQTFSDGINEIHIYASNLTKSQLGKPLTARIEGTIYYSPSGDDCGAGFFPINETLTLYPATTMGYVFREEHNFTSFTDQLFYGFYSY